MTCKSNEQRKLAIYVMLIVLSLKFNDFSLAITLLLIIVTSLNVQR